MNESAQATGEVVRSLRESPEIAALVTWSRDIQGKGNTRTRAGGLFERDRYVTPTSIRQQIVMAQDAVENDDVVGSVADQSEALAFGRIGIKTDDSDQTDIWQQIADDLDLETRMREIWREEFCTSNVTIAVWWGNKTYKVGGKTQAGVAKRKVFDNLRVPVGITVLDPLKTVPVGNFLFNQDQLAYIADWTEQDPIDSALLGGNDKSAPPDQVISQLITGKYEASFRDRRDLSILGIDPNMLYRMNPAYVYRQTATRSQYQRWSPVRLKSIFELLDLKHQLRQMDRAHLLGATNFILLVRKGTDNRPADQTELSHLQEQVRHMATVPVLVGDHRLQVDIITPKLDKTLDPERHLGLDVRIAARLWGMFITGHAGRGDDSVKLTKVVARGLENKRDAQRRSFTRAVLKATFEANEQLTERPRLQFWPRRIALDFDPTMASYLLDLRDRGDLSRESILSEIDYDQNEEAHQRETEIEKYDHIFQTQVPYSPANPANPNQPNQQVTPPGQPGPTDPKAGGRRLGGRRKGGGAAPGSGQGKAPARPTVRTQAAAKDEVPDDDETKEDQ